MSDTPEFAIDTLTQSLERALDRLVDAIDRQTEAIKAQSQIIDECNDATLEALERVDTSIRVAGIIASTP